MNLKGRDALDEFIKSEFWKVHMRRRHKEPRDGLKRSSRLLFPRKNLLRAKTQTITSAPTERRRRIGNGSSSLIATTPCKRISSRQWQSGYRSIANTAYLPTRARAHAPLGTRDAERLFGLGERKIGRTFVRTAASEHHLARTDTKNGQGLRA